MKALSIRQPWAWAIIHAGKDIENRAWSTAYRGPLLIHAAYRWHAFGPEELARQLGRTIPATQLHRGGIVGMVELVDCVSESHSPWFQGPYGFVLRNPQPLPFYPCRGARGIFDLDMNIPVEIDGSPS